MNIRCSKHVEDKKNRIKINFKREFCWLTLHKGGDLLSKITVSYPKDTRLNIDYITLHKNETGFNTH